MRVKCGDGGWVSQAKKIRSQKLKKNYDLCNVEFIRVIHSNILLEKLFSLKRVHGVDGCAHSKEIYSTKLPRVEMCRGIRVELDKRCPSISTKRKGGQKKNPKTYLRIHQSIHSSIHPFIHPS
jgi:hypothetical protein